MGIHCDHSSIPAFVPLVTFCKKAIVAFGLKGFECFLHGGRQWAATVASELGVDFLQSVDEIADFSPGVRSAGGGAKVGAAAEGAVEVNEATTLRIEQWTSAVGALGEAGAAGGAQGFGGGEGFAFSEVRCAAGEFEMAALGAQRAVAFDGAGGHFRVDRADARDGGRRVRWTARFQSAR